MRLIEVTSQGVVAHRHRFVNWNMGAITNLAPEHIESHGSFENYRDAKLSFLRYVLKKGGMVFLNRDDANFGFFKDALPGERTMTYGKDDEWIKQYLPKSSPMRSLHGEPAKKFLMSDFNEENIALAVAAAREIGIPGKMIAEAIMNFEGVPGRMEFVRSGEFTAVVDYAHTPDSLEAAYRAVKPEPTPNYPHPRLICILGSVGATGDKRTGRDTWKRPEMGKIAAHYCDKIFLANEDPYNEDPEEYFKRDRGGNFNGAVSAAGGRENSGSPRSDPAGGRGDERGGCGDRYRQGKRGLDASGEWQEDPVERDERNSKKHCSRKEEQAYLVSNSASRLVQISEAEIK